MLSCQSAILPVDPWMSRMMSPSPMSRMCPSPDLVDRNEVPGPQGARAWGSISVSIRPVRSLPVIKSALNMSKRASAKRPRNFSPSVSLASSFLRSPSSSLNY
jgi:hypothetical protein